MLAQAPAPGRTWARKLCDVRAARYAASLAAWRRPTLLPRAMTTIYLAGFDVFRKDARAWGEHLKALCAAHGFTGLYPLDQSAPQGLSGPDTARWIYDANIALLRRADLVMANLDDFRGPGEADSGTAFEVGFAVALGKPVWAYSTDAGTLRERVTVATDADGTPLDARGFTVEDFGLGKNLMLACPVRLVQGGAAECLAAMAAARHDIDAAVRGGG
ncbi:putative Nucleoside 2-deoxyribosyltransferase [Cupriavidus taiwanensis LMG 19424]|uniref:Nucleoside 2-deoxyribosyltransferase n=2 Tax=Cupriavidus taiwanensis TaxID=164546 RepID=B3R2T7_CUPTR|nr:putative Nucleoside 2-deoxyribosyltransferase [Cupriavidus taiwanensis LMG 19424]